MLSNVSGFPEFLPRDQIAFNQVLDLIKNTFERYGFSPMETPAVEKTSTLLAKGNDNEIYGIHRLAGEEGSKKDLALRFDLTVPLARYVAQHYGYLTFPYRRYHIAPVWRGERAQAGRYRQFYQCDVDVVGDGELALIHDAELLSIIYEVLKSIGLTRFVIKINHRNLLTGLIKSFGVLDDYVPQVMRIIDKAEKISEKALVTELVSQGLTQDKIAILLELIQKRCSNQDWLIYLRGLLNSTEWQLGVDELSQVLKDAYLFGVPDEFIQIDPSLARGLNYYTGTVYETKLLDNPELGSICGGGRYANLAGTFTQKKLPGVGISIGISRLIPKLIEMGTISANTETPAKVLVTTQNHSLMAQYIQLVQSIRQAGIYAELYLPEKPLSTQMKYASKKGFPFVMIADQAEFDTGCVIVRNMVTGQQTSVAISAIAQSLSS